MGRIPSSKLAQKIVRSFIYVLCFLVILLGTWWSFFNGGHDFSVFHYAWSHIANARYLQIYTDSPDLFYYAPGFAWLFSWLGALSVTKALFVWDLFKWSGFAWFIYYFGRKWNRQFWIPALAIVLCARPILSDLMVGQFNSLMLFAALLALSEEGKSSVRIFSKWFLFSLAAFSKLVLLPILFLPFLSFLRKRQHGWALAGATAGILLIALLPLCSVSISELATLYAQWFQGILAKGIPLETGNQSLAAFVYRFFGEGELRSVFAPGLAQPMGLNWWSVSQLESFSKIWMAIGMFLSVGWIWIGVKKEITRSKEWIAVMIGLLVVPSHIAWKYFFVFSLPLWLMALKDGLDRKNERMLLLAAMFFVVNFSTNSFLSTAFASRFEAFSPLFFCHVLLLAWVARLALNSAKLRIKA